MQRPATLRLAPSERTILRRPDLMRRLTAGKDGDLA